MTIDKLSNAVLAIGSLGVASFALVDVTKAFWGGISVRGFGFVGQLVGKLFGGALDPARSADMLQTLRANWINGSTALADQKSVCKTLVKLQMNSTTSAALAAATGVSAEVLASIARKYATGDPLDPAEQDVAGRFDLQLSALIDAAYQRADQSYRNSAKALAVLFAVLLALVGKLVVSNVEWGAAILAGLLAAPLAPISKDLASALQASAKALQSVKR